MLNMNNKCHFFDTIMVKYLVLDFFISKALINYKCEKNCNFH